MIKKIFYLGLIMLTCNKNFLLSQSIIAYYPFDNNATDLSGNNNNGKIIGGVTAVADRFGNACGALNFNGSDGYIEVPNSNSLQSITQTFSVTCWLKLEDVPLTKEIKWLTLICKGNQSFETINNPQYRVQTFQSSNQSTVSINTNFTEYDKNFLKHPFEINKWNFYTLTYDGNFIKEYLNGSIIWEFPYNKQLTQNSAPLDIGRDIPGSLEFFCGSLDDLKLFNYSLSDAEISKLYRTDSNTSSDDEFILTCPSNISTHTEKNKCSAIVSYNNPILIINCGTATLKQITGLPSGSEFPVGSYMVTFEAKSNSGFKKTCTFKISVKNIASPIFKCPNDTTLIITDSTQNAIKYSYSFPDCIDNCTPFNVQLVSGNASGSAFPVGTTLLKFKASDKSDNSIECSYNVTVKKNVKPMLNILPSVKAEKLICPQDIKKFNDSHKCGAIINYTLNKSENEIKLIAGNKSGSFFPVGETINKFLTSISLNTCSFTVSVIDNEKPELICPNDTIIHLKNAEKKIIVNYVKPLATDNCSIDSLVQIEGLKSGASFPIGTTQNVFQAYDVLGNSSTCSFKIVVIDTAKTAPSSDSVEFKPDLIPDSIRYTKPISFNACIITIVMYDDSQQDNDSISVFFNKKEIVTHEMIKLKKNGAINRALMLNENEPNDFIVKAWNNGSISPNTLKIDFYEGYYLDKMKKIKNRKPVMERTLHSKPGVAAAIYLHCKNQ